MHNTCIIGLLSVANTLFFTGFTLIIQSTVILVAAFALRHLLRRKSMVLQSLILRSCLAALFFVPLVTVIFSVTGIDGLYFHLPSPGVDRLTVMFNDSDTAGMVKDSREPAAYDIDSSIPAADDTPVSVDVPVLLSTRDSDPPLKKGDQHITPPGLQC